MLLALPLLLALSAATSAPAPSRQSLEREVGRFVDLWLAAQNQGNFEDYRRLYAPDFHGIRRSGERTVDLDLAGWTADRARMFKKRMTVRATAVHARPLAGGDVEVSFEQEFSSGDYHDRGPKRLRLRRSGGAFSIGGEEMLRSTLVGGGLPKVAFPLAVDGCAGEWCRCVHGDRVRAAIALHARPGDDSPIVARLKAGTRVDDVAFKTVVLRPGVARLKDPSHRLVYYLGYAAEGACLIHDGVRVAQASCEDELDIEDGGVIDAVWAQIRHQGKVGYTTDHEAVDHGMPGPCRFGGP
jgi:hypothetical protein